MCVCVLMFDDADEREGAGAFPKIKRSFLMLRSSAHGGVDNAYHALRLSAPTSGASTDHHALR